MADTTTTVLALTKPEVGASADSWGGKINADMEILDAVIAANRGMLSGLTLSAAGSTASFGISSGAASAADGYPMVLGSAYTKTTASWAPGSGNGSLDTGAIAASTWYHVHLIRRADTGVVDVLTSLSATAPTLPANYTQSRRIGAMLTNGSSQWVKFTQEGDEFLWDVPVLSVNAQTVDTISRTYTLSVPTGVNVGAVFNVLALNSVGSALLVSSNNQAVQAVSTPAGNANLVASSSGDQAAAQMQIRTDTSAKVRFVANFANVTIYVNTVGWIDRRGMG